MQMKIRVNPDTVFIGQGVWVTVWLTDIRPADVSPKGEIYRVALHGEHLTIRDALLNEQAWQDSTLIVYHDQAFVFNVIPDRAGQHVITADLFWAQHFLASVQTAIEVHSEE